MNNSTIRQRLFILVVVPLLALAVTAANLIGNAYHSYRGARLTEQALRVGVAAGELDTLACELRSNVSRFKA